MTQNTAADPSFFKRCAIVAAVTMAALIISWFVWTTSAALLLIFSAFLVAVGLDGLARFVRKFTGLSQHKSVVITAIVLVALLGTTLTLGSMNVASKAPQLRDQVAQSVDQIQSKIQTYSLTEKLIGDTDSSDAKGTSSTPWSGRLTSELSNAASMTLSTLTDTFVVLVIGLYFALQPLSYQSGLLRLFPASEQKRVAHITAQAAHAIRRWLAGRIISMTLTGIGSALGLWLLDIPFALLLGLIAGLLTFIPYLGAIISAVPALLIALLQGYTALIYTAALYTGLHIIEGYVLAPMIQKRAVSIAPGFLLSAQVLGAAVAGVIGIALAAPIALVLSVVIQLGYVRDIMDEQPHLPGQHDRSE